jgi:hypothetical protein
VFPARSPLTWQHLKRQISGVRLSHLYFGFGRNSTAHRLSTVCFKDDRDDSRSHTDIDEQFPRSCTYFSTKMVVVVMVCNALATQQPQDIMAYVPMPAPRRSQRASRGWCRSRPDDPKVWAEGPRGLLFDSKSLVAQTHQYTPSLSNTSLLLPCVPSSTALPTFLATSLSKNATPSS